MSEMNMSFIDELVESLFMTLGFVNEIDIDIFICELKSKMLDLLDSDYSTDSSESSDEDFKDVREDIKVKDLGYGFCELE